VGRLRIQQPVHRGGDEAGRRWPPEDEPIAAATGATMNGPSHAKLHQAENQAHGYENQFLWRRGRLGMIIPAVTLILAAIAVIAYLIVN
jgi:hypothetical protein